MHSVRLEPTKLILTGTRITYRATGTHHLYTTELYITSPRPPSPSRLTRR